MKLQIKGQKVSQNMQGREANACTPHEAAPYTSYFLIYILGLLELLEHNCIFLRLKCLPGVWRDGKRLKDTVLQAAELDMEEKER